MTTNYRTDVVDLMWSHVGDFTLKNGDIQDTSDYQGKAFLQEIETRIFTTLGDWKAKNNLGSTVTSYFGQNNDPFTAQGIQDSINFSLTHDDFLKRNDFELITVPISETEILIRVRFLGGLTQTLFNSKIMLNIILDLEGEGPYLVR